MNTIQDTAFKERLYYLDWLRVIAFGLLVFYHSGLIFVDWGFHIQNSELSSGMKLPMLFLNQWRLPLLFFVSGVGVQFALGVKIGSAFVKERFIRLFIPLVFGILVVIPPQVYYERLSHGMVRGSYLEFYPEFFKIGTFTWNHLWFIVYLFVFTLLTFPLFFYLRSGIGKDQMSKLVLFLSTKKFALLLLVIPLFLIEFFLRDSWPDTRNLVSDWYNFFFYCMVFIYGYFIAANVLLWNILEKERWIYLTFGIGSFLMIYLGQHQDGENFLEGTSGGVLIFKFFKCLNIISWILCCLGFARRYINFNNPLLRYTNRAVYPFYILHQTVLMAIGYYVIKLEIGILLKYTLIVSGTFIITMALYEFIIRRVKLVGFFFGLKYM